MSGKESARQPEHLSSKQVRQILERAVAIDITASESMSLDHLRAAADEAGISRASLAAAVREVCDAGQPETAPLPAESPSLLRTRVPLTAAGAIGIAVLLVFMWLVPGILQHVAQ